MDRQGRGNGRTPSPGEQQGVEVPYCPPPYSRRSWTASAELKATTTTPRPTTAGSQAGQPEQEGRSDPGPGTTGTAPGGEAASGTGNCHWDSWLPGLSEEAWLSPQCCLQCSTGQVGQDRKSSLPPRAPVLQEQQPETEQRGGEGSGDPRPEQAQGQVGQKRIREEAEVTAMEQERPEPAQERQGEETRAKYHRPRRSRQESEPRGLELCQRLQLHTIMSQQLSHMIKRCWLAFLCRK